MSAPGHRLSVVEKVGYGLSDAATNFVFTAVILFQARYYTDTVGVAPATAGWIFIATRSAGGVFDLVFGAAADRTRTRWGRFRPWLLWTAVPFALVFWLAFRVPGGAGWWRMAYAWGTAILLLALYSANNTPYSALTGVITADPVERTRLSTYRMACAMVGGLVAQGLMLPLVGKLGGGDDAVGWSLTIGVFAVLVALLNLATFAAVKERVAPAVPQDGALRRDAADLLRCRPWLILFGVALLMSVMGALRGSALDFYFRYYLEPGAIEGFLSRVGLAPAAGAEPSLMSRLLDTLGLVPSRGGAGAAEIAFSLFNVTATTGTLAGMAFSSALTRRFGRRNVFAAGLGLAGLLFVAFLAVPRDACGAAFALGAVSGVLSGPCLPLLWVMIADVPDYTEWKNARRAAAFAFGGIVLASKLGFGLGGALVPWLLSAHGYVPHAVQEPAAIEGIRLSVSVYAGAPLLLAAALLLAHPLSEPVARRMGRELAERRGPSGMSERPAA